jgi:hypothetical protein
MNTDTSTTRISRITSEMGTRLEQVLDSSSDSFPNKRIERELRGYAERLKHMQIKAPPRRIKTSEPGFKSGLTMLTQAQKLASKAYLALSKTEAKSAQDPSDYKNYIGSMRRNLKGIIIQLEKAIYLSQKEIQEASVFNTLAAPLNITRISSDLDQRMETIKEVPEVTPYIKRPSSCCGDFDTDANQFFDSHEKEMKQVIKPDGDVVEESSSIPERSHNSQEDNLAYVNSESNERSGKQEAILARPAASPKIASKELISEKPVYIRCRKCGNSGNTIVKQKAKKRAWVLCGVTSMLGLVCGCCLIPFFIPKMKKWEHYCPHCNTFISVNSEKSPTI